MARFLRLSVCCQLDGWPSLVLYSLSFFNMPTDSLSTDFALYQYSLFVITYEQFYLLPGRVNGASEGAAAAIAENSIKVTVHLVILSLAGVSARSTFVNSVESLPHLMSLSVCSAPQKARATC